MKAIVILFSISLFFTNALYSQSFYQLAYKSKTNQLDQFLDDQLKVFYDKDDDVREEAFDQMKKAVGQSKRQSDRNLPFEIMKRFILGKDMPKSIKKDEDLLEDIQDFQMDVLGYLIDNVKEEDRSTSDRQLLMEHLTEIATKLKVKKFEFIQKSVNAVMEAGDSDTPVLKHTAMVAAKAFAIQDDERWEDVAENSANLIAADLGSSNIDLQRFSFFLSIDTMKAAPAKTDAIKHLWSNVTSNYDNISSPILQSSVKTAALALIKENSGDLFKEEIEDLKEALEDEESLKKLNKLPLKELFEEFAGESDMTELESMMDRLIKLAKSDRVVLYQIYQYLIQQSFAAEVTPFKLRLINQTIIKITHDTASPLFFYRASTGFLSEISQFGDNYKSQIPLTMLNSLLTSTEYLSLISPVLEEIAIFQNFPLPIWVKRQLVATIYAQAGDSPNEKVAEAALKILITIADTHNEMAVRFEAFNRIKQLAKSAAFDSIKTLSSNWLTGK